MAKGAGKRSRRQRLNSSRAKGAIESVAMDLEVARRLREAREQFPSYNAGRVLVQDGKPVTAEGAALMERYK